jgi:hypothetical protein
VSSEDIQESSGYSDKKERVKCFPEGRNGNQEESNDREEDSSKYKEDVEYMLKGWEVEKENTKHFKSFWTIVLQSLPENVCKSLLLG